MEAMELETKRQKTQRQNKGSLMHLQIKSYEKGLIVKIHPAEMMDDTKMMTMTITIHQAPLIQPPSHSKERLIQ